MTDVGIIFSTLAFVVLANGAILTVTSREFPLSLRRSSYYWQAGTFIFSTGYAVFAFGEAKPQPLIIILTNTLVIFGLTAYCAAIRSFYSLKQTVWLLLPGALASVCISVAALVSLDNFKFRLVVFSVAFLWLLLLGMHTLWFRSRQKKSLSALILFAIFGVVATFTLARLIAFLGAELDPSFTITAGGNWLNFATPFFMPMMLVVATTAFVLMFSDDLRKQVEILASTDLLTDLPNRRYFASFGEEWFERARSKDESFAVALIDIDNFKSINDGFGHAVGDSALKHVAANLRQQMRQVDIIARYGGEEFAALIACSDLPETCRMVDRLRFAVEQSDFNAGNTKVPITLSAGVTTFHPNDTVFDDVLRAADVALYAAKAAGRNRVECTTGRPENGQV